MNLIKELKDEITELNLTDKVQIKDYIYIRTGELFNYDPMWVFSSYEERQIIRNKHVDISNVTDFNIVCFSWASMYKELLNEFGISSNVVFTENKEHAFVEILLDGKKYIADLMLDYQDIMRIKFGMETCFNCQIVDDKYNLDNYKKDDEIDFLKGKNMEDILNKIKLKLQFLKLRLKSNNEEYVYQVFKTIETIMNFPRANIGYISGLKFICKLLEIFVDTNYHPYNTHFFNNENGIYIEVYTVYRNNNICYFAYKKNENNTYELHEITSNDIRLYLNNLKSIRAYNLTPNKEYLVKKKI